jgi:hypothetical protein
MTETEIALVILGYIAVVVTVTLAHVMRRM